MSVLKLPAWFRPSRLHALAAGLLTGLGAFVLVGAGRELARYQERLRQDLRVVVLIAPSLPDDQARLWSEALPKADPEIRSVEFISREQALEAARQDPALMRPLGVLKDNPFPSSAVLRFSDAAWLERHSPAERLPVSREVQEVRWDAEARSGFQTLAHWHAGIRRLGLWTAGILAVGLLFGLFRWRVERGRIPELLLHLLLGGAGGLAAIVLGSVILQVGAQISADQSGLNALGPILAGLAAGLSLFSGEGNRGE